MKCTKCKTDNGLLRSCQQCGAIFEGRVVDNVTGKTGYRHSDGSFTPDRKEIWDGD